MEFTPGQHVVHPVHGATTVVERLTRVVGGEEREYVVLEHVEQDLTLQLPVSSLDEADLRPALSEDDVDGVLKLLCSEADGEGLSWRKMRARNEQKLRSGTASEVAEVIRDLLGKKERKGRISPSEITMLRKARERLVAELSLVVDGDADELLDDVLVA